jgi:hypothetical protein
LHRSERMPIKAIARVLGVSRNTVKAALRSGGPPRYARALRGSLVDEVEPRIRELLQAFPTMPATVIAERIGWSHSIRILRDRVAELRPVYLPPDPASRTANEAGDVAQCDLWFPPIPAAIGRRVEVHADLNRVRVVCDGRVVADHARIWAKHQSISDREHLAVATALRRERQGLRAVGAALAGTVLTGPRADIDAAERVDVQVRDLGDYDTALGLELDEPSLHELGLDGLGMDGLGMDGGMA